MTATAPAPQTPANRGWRHPHRWVIIGVLIALVVIGLITYQFHARSPQADAKADQLITALHQAGLPAPGRDTIARVLGPDGGPLCENPGSALNKALLDTQLVNGAAFVGQRPILGEGKLIRAGEIALRVYCPEELAAYQAYVRTYHLDAVSGS
jgi:hypothetical protein